MVFFLSIYFHLDDDWNDEPTTTYNYSEIYEKNDSGSRGRGRGSRGRGSFRGGRGGGFGSSNGYSDNDRDNQREGGFRRGGRGRGRGGGRWDRDRDGKLLFYFFIYELLLMTKVFNVRLGSECMLK